MNYLAIDTSNTTLLLIACKDGKTFVYEDKTCGVKHSQSVMVETEKLLDRAGLTLSDCDFFACVVGAGSFTGIRIGVSTVKALAFATNKPVLSITTFDTLAYNKDSGKHLAIINAKHGSFYACGYNGYEVEFEPSFISENELNELKKEYKLLAFEEIENVNAEIVSVSTGLINAIENKKHLVSFDANSLVPLYIRKSQAEEGR